MDFQNHAYVNQDSRRFHDNEMSSKMLRNTTGNIREKIQQYCLNGDQQETAPIK